MLLCEICQRYNLESYSQLEQTKKIIQESCVRYVKDTILRAIHNMNERNDVMLKLCEICQRYNLESYSQQQVAAFAALYSCVRYVKDTILRAIHNIEFRLRFLLQLCEICQRYNLESYSQLC